MITYLEYKNKNRLWAYHCDNCSSNNAFNGDPITGSVFRGGGKCFDCGESFSVISKTPVHKEGPLAYVKHKYLNGHWVAI